MWSIIGHAAPLAALQRALQSERPPHAWLFTGTEGVGKAAAAIEFAAALNCTSEVVAPGGICDEPDHRDHPDSRDLRICQIRRLERLLTLSPYASGRRVAIVDAADTMRAEAANAFLKTLEEPPGESVIILLAEREERLPETVQSRCQKLRFRPVDRQTIMEALQAENASPEAAASIAAAAAGKLGWALRTLEDSGLLEARSRMLDEAVRLAHAGRAERFAWAREAESRAPGVRERYLGELSAWESWWRDVLLYSAGGRDGAANQDRRAQLTEEGKLYSASEIAAFLQSISQTKEYLQANVDQQLALENLMLDLPSPAEVR